MRGECAAVGSGVDLSTDGGRVPYASAMRKIAHLAPAALFTLALAAGCKDETPPNEPGEFGDPCLVGEPDDSPDGCRSGHYCFQGFCSEDCSTVDDCQPIDGWERSCEAGVCQILCSVDKQCPQTLNTPLVCEAAGRNCEGESKD